MGRKTVALSLDEEIYEKYQKYCKQKGIVLSRQVDKFMEKNLKEVDGE